MTAEWFSSYEAEIGRAKSLADAFRASQAMRTPTLPMIYAAFIGGDLEYEDLEPLVEAALLGRPVRIPEPMLSLFFR